MTNDSLILIGGRIKVSPESILMLKADINYTQIYLEDGSLILSSTTMGILENRLKEYDFFRPNRSVIINLRYMTCFQNKEITGSFPSIRMSNDMDVPVSRRRTPHFLKTVQTI